MVSHKEIKSFVDQVVEKFQPDKVILFGSYAYGEPNEDSDVDLMVVMPHRRGLKKAVQIRLACRSEFAMDLLVRSPAQLRQRVKMGDPFVQEILSKGIVLHESDNTRVD